MKIELSYGQSGLTVELPASTQPTIIRKPAIPVPASPEAVVAAAMENPIASPTLGEIAQGKASACILICDITRPVPNGLFLQ
ncbi:MAG: lactate racemase domain-containing protein, partial [Alphaproteobacteria bacterium]|nr:lactate racemase domain-containing protein [Alphaproteobacteria bacterium]